MRSNSWVDWRVIRRVAEVMQAGLLAVALGASPAMAAEQTQSPCPAAGEREFTLSGMGSSDRGFDSSRLGASADLGWYYSERTLIGVRQSLNDADVEGESIDDGISDSAFSGVELGMRYYVLSETFLMGRAQ